MIVDNVIDEVTARYFCAANKRFIEDAVKNAREAARENSAEKLGIQTAMALGPNPEKKLEQAKTQLDEAQLNEGFWSWLFNSPPAWVEEPTGFNLAAPEQVFKSDVQGGIEGYNTGTKMAAGVGAAAVAASIPVVRNAAVQIGKQAVKHPVAATVATVAATHPGATVDIVKNTAKDAGAVASALEACKPAFDTVCGWFKPLVDFFKEHPLYASAAGAVGYGLLKTLPLWWPYIRRLGYELTSGKTLAKVDFEANDSSWSFEYTLRKNKWVLLNAGKIASPEDSTTFMKTRFAQRFIEQCKKNFESLFAHKDVILAQASLVGGSSLRDTFKKFIDSEQAIRANMFYGKMIFENGIQEK